MPIITVQRRMAEQGRIRLGQKVATSNGKTRPDKLDRFRFTSPNRGLIEQIASKYGGTAKAWDNAGKSEWEVISDARAIPVIVVKGGFSQWHEAWSKGGLQHRCDGEKDAAGDYCDPDDPAHREAIAKPTTRLSVMLAEIETLGVWRMESKGWNAAAELPSMAELAMHVGDLVPATLSLAERSSIIDGPRGPQTSRFVVPVLDLNVTKARLVEIAGGAGGLAAIEGASNALQIEAGAPDVDDLIDAIADATSKDELNRIWRQAGESGRLTDDLKARIIAAGSEIDSDSSTAGAASIPAPEVGAEEVVEGELMDDDPAAADAAWTQCVAYAGGTYGWTSKQLMAAFTLHAGKTTDRGSAADFEAFLQAMRDGTVALPEAVA